MFEAYRDIAIKYDDMAVDSQVPVTDIVSYYFKQTFKKEHLQNLISMAKERGKDYKALIDMKDYDVRLNSDKPTHSVKEAHLEFGTYPRTKRLTFYIVPYKRQQKIEEKEQDGLIEFQLMSGGRIEKTIEMNIKDKEYNQVEIMIRKTFGIESSQAIQFLNISNSTIIALDRNDHPLKKLKLLRLSKVGVKRVYSAG